MARLSPPEEAARDLYLRLLEAWNDRDAEGFAAPFAEDGLMIGFDGTNTNGSGVADHLRPIVKDHPTAAYVAKVRTVRSLGASHVLLYAMAGMVPPGKDRLKPDVNALQTLVAEESEGDWRVVLFQTTPAQYHGRPDLVEKHTAELQRQLESGTTRRLTLYATSGRGCSRQMRLFQSARSPDRVL